MSAIQELELFDDVQHGENIREAQRNLKGIINETNLIHSDFFSKEFGNNVYLKPENLQFTGSFKIRGAFNKISNLTEEEKRSGVIASSAGNHAQGVAYSCQKLGIESTIVMPNITPLIKVKATQSYGAEVVLHGNVYDEAYQEACRLSESKGYTFIHPFDDYDVICGQGTIGMEIVDQLSDVDEILVPIGGGGLISGIAMAVKSINPNIRVIGVEPQGAMSMKASIDAGKITELDIIKTTAEGVAVKKPGNMTFDLVNKYVDGIITVSEEEIMEVLLLLLEKHKIIAETAGVLSLAALKKLNVKNKKVVCVLSGGNIDVVTISSVVNKGLVSRGRIFCFSVDLPDTPGQLLQISKILSDLGGNVIKLDHNQFKATDRCMEVQLEVTVETNGHDHINEITKRLKDESFIINRIY